MTYGKQILELTNITKSYSGVTVLRNMDFALHEGEVHCIVGENGAGKSTFIKILSGAITPDYGDIILFGQKREYNNPQVPIELGISTIYQDSDLIDTLTVADNIFLEMCIRDSRNSPAMQAFRPWRKRQNLFAFLLKYTASF